MSRLRVVHTSRFRYAGPVVASYNEARMTPTSHGGQRVVSSRLRVEPHTWSRDFTDYWGTAVTAFEVLDPHEEMVVRAEHVVDLEPATRPARDVDWSELWRPDVVDDLAEFLADTPTTVAPVEVVGLALECGAGLSPAEAAEAVCRRVRDELEYIPGVTTAHTPAAEAWEARAGVCQDIAHLAVGALHALGVPARYVSGYLHPATDARVGQPVVGQSHAWVEWYVGEWVGFDPTNRIAVGESHVVLGRGRSYDDVPPLRGIYAGAGTQDLSVEVQITREA